MAVVVLFVFFNYELFLYVYILAWTCAYLCTGFCVGPS